MPTFAAVLILLVLLVGAQVQFENFLTPRNLSALLLDNAYLVVLAVGLTLVIITGGIDLSVGSVMAFTGILCASLLSQGCPAIVVVPLMLLGGGAIGLLIGVLVQYFNVQPFIASLAGLFLARGLAFVVSLSSIRVEDPACCGCSARASRSASGTSPRPASSRCCRRARRGRHAVDPLRPHHLRARRRRAVGAADGPEGRAHQDRRLRHQRRLRRARRGCS